MPTIDLPYSPTHRTPPEDAPVIPSSAVRVGDILNIKGFHPVSRGISDMDDCYTDHVAVVSSVDNDTVVFAEQNFDGFRFTGFSGYDDEVEDVIVRRHVCDGAEQFAPPLLRMIAASKPTYAWDRLLDIVLLGLSNYVPILNGYTSERHQGFAERINLLFLMGAETIHDTNAQLCVDPMLSVYSKAGNYMAANTDSGPMDWSIVLPVRNCGSLPVWRSATYRFLEVLEQNSSPSVDPIGSLVHLLNQASIQPERAQTEATPASSESRAALPKLNGGSSRSLNDVVRALDDYLLDRLLTRRFLATPRDLLLSPSLVTVGHLDPAAFAGSGRN